MMFIYFSHNMTARKTFIFIWIVSKAHKEQAEDAPWSKGAKFASWYSFQNSDWIEVLWKDNGIWSYISKSTEMVFILN